MGCASGMEHGTLSKYVALKGAKIWYNTREFVFGMGPSPRSNCVAFKIVKIRFRREGCAEGIRHTLENSENPTGFVSGVCKYSLMHGVVVTIELSCMNR